MTPPIINSNNILLELSNNYTFECLDKSGITPHHGICRSKASALFLLSHFHLSYSYLIDNSIINYIHTLLSSSSSSVGIA